MGITIYTDGGCSGNPGPGGWAFIIKYDPESSENKESHGIMVEGWGVEENTTNNRMELRAVIASLEALFRLNKGQTALLCTDSQYVQKGISEWIHTWKKNGWKTSDKKPVKNDDLWKYLDELSGRFHITWKWVKGHAGNEYNEYCDKLTQRAIAHLKDNSGSG